MSLRGLAHFEGTLKRPLWGVQQGDKLDRPGILCTPEPGHRGSNEQRCKTGFLCAVRLSATLVRMNFEDVAMIFHERRIARE